MEGIRLNILNNTLLTDNFDLAKDKIEKFNKPIRQNELLDIYIDDCIDKYYKLDVLIKDKTIDKDIIEQEIKLLKREAKSIITFENNESIIDVYTGELLSKSYKLQYIDSCGMILKIDKGIYNQYKYFMKTKNNIWIKAYKDECYSIHERFSVWETLNF